MIGSLSHGNIPPTNPYVSGFELHYYWFFHLFVAFWKTIFPGYRPDFMLVQFSLVAVCIFVSSFYVIVRKYVSSQVTLALTLLLLLVGGSYKGIYALSKLREMHLPWLTFGAWNVEGILRWRWNAPQIDMLYRAFLYAPQHLIALCVFFLLLWVWTSPSTIWGRIVVYATLFASVGFSFFIGGVLSILTALFLTIQSLRRFKERWAELVLSGALGLGFLFVYVSFFHVVEWGSSATPIHFGLDPAIASHLFSYTFLNWGAVFLIGVAGIFWHSEKIPFRILFFFLIFCFLFIYFVELELPGVSDISLKMGYFSFVLLLIFAASLIDRIVTRYPTRKPLVIGAVIVLVIPAFGTWAMEAFNSQDIGNGKFTTYISREDAEVLQWMRKNLSGSAVIQNYSWGKGYLQEFVTSIPPFAERSVFLGDKNFSRIFQIPKTLVDQRAKIIWNLFHEESPARIYQACRLIGIRYIFLSTKVKEPAQEVRQELVEPYFSVIKQNGESLLFQLNDEIEVTPEDLERKVLKEEKDRPVLTARFGKNFYEPEIQLATETFRWMSNDAEIFLTAKEEMEGEIQFTASSFLHDRIMEVYLEGQFLQKITVTPHGKKVSFPVNLPAGDTRILIRCPEGADRAVVVAQNNDPRLLSIKIQSLRFTK